MNTLSEIARAILVRLPSEHVKPLIIRLREISETAGSALERAIAKDLLVAIRGWED